jgi:hypothetical protein
MLGAGPRGARVCGPVVGGDRAEVLPRLGEIRDELLSHTPRPPLSRRPAHRTAAQRARDRSGAERGGEGALSLAVFAFHVLSLRYDYVRNIR